MRPLLWLRRSERRLGTTDQPLVADLPGDTQLATRQLRGRHSWCFCFCLCTSWDSPHTYLGLLLDQLCCHILSPSSQLFLYPVLCDKWGKGTEAGRKWGRVCNISHHILVLGRPEVLEPWLGKVLCLPTWSFLQGQGEGTMMVLFARTINSFLYRSSSVSNNQS